MVPAQQHEVVETGRATVGPVSDVMTIDESRVHAAGKPTAAVAPLQRAMHRRRNHPRFAADIERFAAAALENSDHRAVAGDPAHRFGREHRPVLDLRRIIRIEIAVLDQRSRGSVHRELIAVGGVDAFLGTRRFREKSFGENRERIGAPNILRKILYASVVPLLSATMRLTGEQPVHRAIERLQQQCALLSRQPTFEHQ